MTNFTRRGFLKLLGITTIVTAIDQGKTLGHIIIPNTKEVMMYGDFTEAISGFYAYYAGCWSSEYPEGTSIDELLAREAEQLDYSVHGHPLDLDSLNMTCSTHERRDREYRGIIHSVDVGYAAGNMDAGAVEKARAEKWRQQFPESKILMRRLWEQRVVAPKWIKLFSE